MKTNILLSLLIAAVLLVGIVSANAAQLREEPGEYVWECPLYSVRVGANGRLLSLLVEGEELLRPQPAFLAGPVLRQAGGATLRGRAEGRTMRWRFEEDYFEVAVEDAAQQGAARLLLPLSNVLDFAVLPKEGGETQRLGDHGHRDDRLGARFITAAGTGFETTGRTTLLSADEGGETPLAFFYYTGDGFTNSEAIRFTPFREAPAADLLALDFLEFPENFHYADVEKLEFPLGVENHGRQEIQAVVRLRLEKFKSGGADGETVAEDSREVVLKGEGLTRMSFEFALPEAGPYEFVVALEVNGEEAKSQRGSLMVDMEDWQLPDLEPEDFDAFWERTLSAMRERPLEPEFSEPEDRRAVPAAYRLVSFNGIDDTRVRGFIAYPEDASRKPWPARLSLGGGGYGTAPLDTSGLERGFVSLCISAHDMPFGGESGRHHPQEYWMEDPPYQEVGAASRETFYYRRIYANAVRAVDFLKSLPEVDPTRIAVGGGSQGGAVAIAVGGLAAEELALVMASSPGRSRWELLNGEWRGVGYFTDDAMPEGHTRESLFREVLAYYDTSYHARRIRAPFLMVTPMKDEIDPWPLQYWAWREATGSPDRRICLIPWARHNSSSPKCRAMGAEMMDRYLLDTDKEAEGAH